MTDDATDAPALSLAALVACCDTCGAHLEVDGLAQLVAAGWKALNDGRAFCPECDISGQTYAATGYRTSALGELVSTEWMVSECGGCCLCPGCFVDLTGAA